MTEAVRIRAIAGGGDGVGTLADGRTVFVPRTAPADLVELAGITRSKRLARARIGRIVEPAADRVPPRCPHYEGDDCGGCQVQHLSAPAQQEAKRSLVGEALRRIGHLDTATPMIEASDVQWEYRAKITLAAKGSHIGFRRVGRPDDVFDLVRCHIARPELAHLWQVMRQHRRLLPPDTAQVVLRIDRSGLCHAIVRVTGTTVWLKAREMGRALASTGVRAVLWWEPEGGVPRTVAGAGEAYPAMVFEQVHPVMGDRVRAFAVAALGEVSARRVWDLYAGIGETSVALAAQGAQVESVELDRRAVALAESLGPAAGIIRHAGRVEDFLPRLAPAEAVIVNPPRTGLSEMVSEGLAAHAPARLVYVSCDPATLARDVARLAPRYAVSQVHAFDLFPQTAHIETVLTADRR